MGSIFPGNIKSKIKSLIGFWELLEARWRMLQKSNYIHMLG